MTGDVSLSEITSLVSEHTGIAVGRLLSEGRSHPVVRYRQVVMFLARAHSRKSFPEIARYLRRRDHTTVIFGARRIAELRETDAGLNALINDLSEQIKALPEKTISHPAPNHAELQKPVRFIIKRPSKQQTKFVMRKCLGSDCGQSFKSFHVGERFCSRCRKLRDGRTGIDPRYESAAI
tara:strand:- start:29309 stop:29845 length:537 start_codon:yes stop_codon:yes gene_type:complete